MTPVEKWALVQKSLIKACEELELMGWPQPRRRDRRQHMTGYSRGRGRRVITGESP